MGGNGSAGPGHREFEDLGIGTETEVEQGFVGGEEAAVQPELAGQLERGCLEADGGADAPGVAAASSKADQGAMARLGVVAEDRERFAEIHDDQIEVAVAVEVPEGRSEACGKLVQTPGRADRLEGQIPPVAEGEVGFAKNRCVAPAPIAAITEFAHQVRMDEIPRHSVRDEQIDPSVVVQISELGGPGPVGVGETGQVRDFENPAGAGGEVEGVAKNLPGDGALQEPAVPGIFEDHHAAPATGPGHLGGQ